MIHSNNCISNDNYVYLNKIFYNNSENSSPIMSALTTNATDFTQQIKIGSNVCTNQQKPCDSCGCGCGNVAPRTCGFACDCCCDFPITADTTFNITNAYVLVRSFRLTTPATLTAGDVTVEGLPVTALTPNGNQYLATITDIMGEITNCPCISPCSNPCPGEFVMVTAAGPWDLVATIVVEGTAYGNGPSCQFKICYNTAVATPIPVTGSASFAFCNVNIPCQVSGVAPTLMFDFDACAKLLSPTITVTCTDGVCTPVLSGFLAITPQVNLQVTRPSLFNLGNTEIELPCDDLGQCDPCDAIEAECIPQNIACQCCNTNGYSF